MISHNLCFSTCLGNLDSLFKGRFKKVGVNQECDVSYQRFIGKSEEEISKMIFVAPNNVAYLRKSEREGIIPQILEEFL